MMILIIKMMMLLLIMMAMMMVMIMIMMIVMMMIMMMMTFETLAGKLVPLGPVLQIPWHALGQVGRASQKLLADDHKHHITIHLVGI